MTYIYYIIFGATIFLIFEYLYILFMFYISYRIDCCKILCLEIGKDKFDQTSVELIKTITTFHYDVFELVTFIIFGKIF